MYPIITSGKSRCCVKWGVINLVSNWCILLICKANLPLDLLRYQIGFVLVAEPIYGSGPGFRHPKMFFGIQMA